MSELTVASRVWNRAGELVGQPGPKVGDSQLSAMLLAHNITMNGGVLHCVEALSTQELDAALDGYRYFGLNAGADIIETARTVLPAAALEAECKLDAAYAAAVPADSLIFAIFERHFQSHPEAYGAIEA